MVSGGTSASWAADSRRLRASAKTSLWEAMGLMGGPGGEVPSPRRGGVREARVGKGRLVGRGVWLPGGRWKREKSRARVGVGRGGGGGGGLRGAEKERARPGGGGRPPPPPPRPCFFFLLRAGGGSHT